MATDIIARGMITEYKSGTNINFKENDDGSVTISASGDVSSEDTVARDAIDNHKSDTSNPHNVTPAQIGLGNVDNTADLDKPISTAVQTALDNKANIKHTHKKSDITDFPNSLPADGGNADTVNNHTVGTDVPTNALFTDTVYDDTEIDNRVKKNTDDISQLFDITKGGESVNGNSSYTIENTVDYPLVELSLYGKSTQNGTPTPENPVNIVSVGDSGTVNITANNGADVSVTVEITTALPLCGIPVSSGGNYTDSNGQQWVCDELIYNADGTGKIVKYAGIYTFTGNENFAFRNNDNGRCVYAIANLLQYKYYSGTRTVSDKYVCIDTVNNASEAISRLKIGETCCFFNNTDPNPSATAMYFGSRCTTVNDFKSEIAGSTIIYVLTTPLEIQLTAAEMTALRQLQTFNGTTSISNSSGAEMSVKYCTNKALSEFVRPVTMGLQKQIDELRAAILSMGGNV